MIGVNFEEIASHALYVVELPKLLLGLVSLLPEAETDSCHEKSRQKEGCENEVLCFHGLSALHVLGQHKQFIELLDGDTPLRGIFLALGLRLLLCVVAV